VESRDTKPLPLSYHLEQSLQLLFDIRVCHDLSSPLRCPDEMVVTDVRTVLELI
jgi:hypothetical protein